MVLEELVAERAAPQVDAGFDGDVVPAAGGLRAVVAAAGRGEVAAAGRSVVRVWHSVFAVAGVGGAEAEREGADQVAQLGLEPEPSGGLVGADVEMLGKVEDRLDRDLGVGVAAPDPDLFGGDRAGGLVDAGESARAEDGGMLEGGRAAPPDACVTADGRCVVGRRS